MDRLWLFPVHMRPSWIYGQLCKTLAIYRYAENLLGKLTQMTAKLDSLTEKTDRLERLVEVSQNATKTLEKSMDNRLRVLEQGFNEIQRNVQALRDKAELEQEAKDLKKMSLSDEHDQSKVPFESEMSKVSTQGFSKV